MEMNEIAVAFDDGCTGLDSCTSGNGHALANPVKALWKSNHGRSVRKH